MVLFEFDDQTKEYICNEQWSAVAVYLKDLWERDVTDVVATLRYGCALWYILTFSANKLVVKTQKKANAKFDYEAELSRVHEFALSQFKDNVVFLAIWGRIIYATPYYFSLCRSAEEYDETRQSGAIMIQTAYNFSPENPFFYALLCSIKDETQEYSVARSQMGEVWHMYLEEDDFIGTYFLSLTT